jgi:hypothetical protein
MLCANILRAAIQTQMTVYDIAATESVVRTQNLIKYNREILNKNVVSTRVSG